MLNNNNILLALVFSVSLTGLPVYIIRPACGFLIWVTGPAPAQQQSMEN